MGGFREIPKISTIFGCQKQFQLSEYESDIYHYKAPDQLGISNTLFVSGGILKFFVVMDNDIFRENHKSLHKIAKFKYFAKVIT